MLKRLIVLIFLIIISANVRSQIIENFRQEIIGNEVNIYFDLIANIEGQIFEVVLSCSDSTTYTQRLYYATGDVGKGVEPGKNKKITWSNKEELTSYSLEELSFEIKANIQSSALYFIYPRDRKTIFKRGSTEKIEWLGGEINESLVIDLYRDDKKNKVVANTSNKGNLYWNIPGDIKPGNNYQLRMTVANKPGNVVLSSKFNIKRKIPNALKIIPSALIVGITTYLITNKKPNRELPGPPAVPDGN